MDKTEQRLFYQKLKKTCLVLVFLFLFLLFSSNILELSVCSLYILVPALGSRFIHFCVFSDIYSL